MKKENIGVLIISVLILFNPILWFIIQPQRDLGVPYWQEFAAELAGSTSMIMMSLATISITRFRWTRPYFKKTGSLHKTLGFFALLLAIGHVVVIPEHQPMTDGGFIGNILLVGLLLFMLNFFVPTIPVLRKVVQPVLKTWNKMHRFIGFFLIVAIVHVFASSPLMSATPCGIYTMLISLTGVISFLVLKIGQLFRSVSVRNRRAVGNKLYGR